MHITIRLRQLCTVLKTVTYIIILNQMLDKLDLFQNTNMSHLWIPLMYSYYIWYDTVGWDE